MAAISEQKRHKYLINKSYQLQYVGALLLATIGAVVFTALITSFVWVFFIMENMDNAVERLVVYMTIWAGLLGLYMIYAGIHISHRTAGPMYHLHMALGELAAGNTEVRVHLRKGDYWQDIAEDFNRAAEKIAACAKVSSDRLQPALDAALAAAQRHPEDADIKKTVELLSDFTHSGKHEA